MKVLTIVYWLILLGCTHQSFSQNISFSEFENLKSKSLETILNTISSKFYELHEVSENVNGGKLVTYKYIGYKNKDFINRAYFTIFQNSKTKEIDQIALRLYDKALVDKFIEQAKINLYLLKDSKIEKDAVSYLYSNDIYDFSVANIIDENRAGQKLVYFLIILSDKGAYVF